MSGRKTKQIVEFYELVRGKYLTEDLYDWLINYGVIPPQARHLIDKDLKVDVRKFRYAVREKRFELLEETIRKLQNSGDQKTYSQDLERFKYYC